MCSLRVVEGRRSEDTVRTYLTRMHMRVWAALLSRKIWKHRLDYKIEKLKKLFAICEYFLYVLSKISASIG